MNYNWPLSVPSFTFLDKLKIAKFIVTTDRWTQGDIVKQYEQKWKEYTGANYVVMTASGSASNELIALRRREELKRLGVWPKEKKVIFPVITWISSISPWLNFDFEPVFVDVSANNMNSTYEDIERALEADTNGEIGTVFYTTLLGFSQDLIKIKKLCDAYGVKLLLDNCESSFSRIPTGEDTSIQICNFVTCSTSLYFSHLTTTGTEGGLIFCQSEEEYEWYKMARSHGMTRGMPDKYKNSDVDPEFDFYMLGSNYRSHNLAAFMGLIDFDRALEYSTDIDNCDSRIRVSQTFMNNLNNSFEKVHEQGFNDNVPFALPIVLSQKAKPDLMKKIKETLKTAKVEARPLVSGNLLHQTAFKKYGNPLDFPRAEWLHTNAIYIGLYKSVKEKHAESLSNALNLLSKI